MCYECVEGYYGDICIIVCLVNCNYLGCDCDLGECF